MTGSRGVLHLAERQRRRERSHRRLVLLGIAVLIVLGISPVFGHHAAESLERSLVERDHVWGLCLIALHLLLEPIHVAFHALLGAGVGYAVYDRVRAHLRARRSLRLLHSCGARTDERAVRAAHAAGLEPRDVRVVTGLPSPAFTIGLFRPRVYVARELLDVLPIGELVAVLAHEAAHVRRRDPLRLMLLRALGCVLFWIPALRRLAQDVADEAEIEADDRAARGRPLVLASAILRLAEWPSASHIAAAVGFQRADLLERRIRRLAGECAPVGTHVTRRSVALAAAALALVWASGLVMAHPMPPGSAAAGAHCERHHGLALSHLFCLDAPSEGTAGCPHDER